MEQVSGSVKQESIDLPSLDLNALVVCSEQLLSACEKAVIAFEDKFGRPRSHTRNKRLKWIYDENRLEHVIVFRVVRIISAFRACLLLLNGGFLQEVAVLLRTIVQFQAEIVFLAENYGTGIPNQHQRKFVDECFKEHFKNPLKPSEGVQPRDIVPRRKVHAAYGRYLTGVSNSTGVQKVIDMEEDIYNGYIHATAQAVLEFYGLGGGTFPEFPMGGMVREDAAKAWIRQIVVYLHRFANKVSTLCEKFGFKEIGWVVTAERRKLEIYADKVLSISFDKPTPRILGK